jgi:Type I phosphodiesterase / nucleotide pyrophosphatase
MKKIHLLLSCFFVLAAGKAQQKIDPPNIFIITIDGFRWQEVFTGADSVLINDTRFTKDTALAKMMYWAVSPNERRQKLLPFFWNVIATKGQLQGNRNFGNEVDAANLYKISYAGYNELLTGTTDLRIFSNKKKYNSNRNILEKLDEYPAYHGKIAAFSSWDVFPYILNQPRNHIPVNSGYDSIKVEEGNDTQLMINAVQQYSVAEKEATRYDLLTFVTAMDYIKHKLPKVVYLSFGETDEFAHSGRYDDYLQSASRFDKMLQELWYMVQTTAGYKGNTSFIITTDHGRGRKSAAAWKVHGPLTAGSGEVWRASIGPDIQPLGEITTAARKYQKELPAIIEQITGISVRSTNAVANTAPISK